MVEEDSKNENLFVLTCNSIMKKIMPYKKTMHLQSNLERISVNTEMVDTLRHRTVVLNSVESLKLS